MLSRLNTRGRSGRPSRTGSRRAADAGGGGGGGGALTELFSGSTNTAQITGDTSAFIGVARQFVGFNSAYKASAGISAAWEYNGAVKLVAPTEVDGAQLWAQGWNRTHMSMLARTLTLDANGLKAREWLGGTFFLHATVWVVNEGYEIKQFAQSGVMPSAGTSRDLVFASPLTAGSTVLLANANQNADLACAGTEVLRESENPGIGGFPLVYRTAIAAGGETTFTFTWTGASTIGIQGVEIGPV